MAVPSSITELSTTAGSNPPDGDTETPQTLDDHCQQIYAFIAQLYASGSVIALNSISGSNDVIASASVPITAYVDGQVFSYISSATNSGNMTINIDSLGAQSILTSSTELAGGDVVNGSGVLIAYDGTNFQLVAVSTTAFGTRARIYGDVVTRNGATDIIRVNNEGDVSVASDIQFYSSGAISAQGSLYLNFDSDNDSTTSKLIIGHNAPTSAAAAIATFREAGDILLGTETAGTGLLRTSSSNAICIELTNSESNNTNKAGRICASRYANADTPFHLIGGVAGATFCQVQIGGGSLNTAPATEIEFYTAAFNAAAAIGTEQGSIDSSGNFFMTSVYSQTTASAANVFVASDGQLKRSTSSGEFKTDVELMDIEAAKKLVYLFRAVWYRSKCDGDRKDWSWYGAIAEEVAAIDPRYVHWGYRNEDYVMVEESTGLEEVPVMEDREVEDSVVEVIDGKAVVRIIKKTISVQAADEYPLFDNQGNPVMRKTKDKKLIQSVFRRPRTEQAERKVMRRRLKDGAELVPVGLMYERFTVPLMLVAKDFEERISSLEEK